MSTAWVGAPTPNHPKPALPLLLSMDKSMVDVTTCSQLGFLVS